MKVFSNSEWKRLPTLFRQLISQKHVKKDRDNGKIKREVSQVEVDSQQDSADSEEEGIKKKQGHGGKFGMKRQQKQRKSGDAQVDRINTSERRSGPPCRPRANLSKIEVNASRPTTVEMDNHADTWCFGPNFSIDSYTGKVCDVSGYDRVVGSTEIRVATGLTVWDDPLTGRSHLLQVNEGLDMRHILDHTLANPNQSRSFGISISDDAWDQNRAFGMQLDDANTMIPFQLQGSTAVFMSRPPTEQEKRDLFDTRIILTSDDSWDPDNVNAPTRKENGEVWNRVKKPVRTRHESEVTSNTSAVQVLRRNVCLDALHVCDTEELDAGLVDSDGDARLVAGISTALTDETLLPRIVSNVRVAHEGIESKKINISDTVSANRHSDISPETLSRHWAIGVETARKTLRVTTQQGIRQAIHPITRRYRTDTMSMKLRRLKATMYTDTVPINVKSLRQNTCYQSYTCENFVHIHPMRNQKEAAASLHRLAEDVGIPAELVSDSAPLLVGPQSDFVKQANFLRTQIRSSEPHTQRQNEDEGTTRILKRRWKNRMSMNNIPKRLWDFGLVYEAQILSMIARGKDGIPGLEKLTGDTCDITEWLDFGFYDRVWFHDQPGELEGPKPGRWLGVSHRIGSALCYHVLTEKGDVLSRTTVQHIPDEDLIKPSVQDQLKLFDENVAKRLNDDNFRLEIGEDVYKMFDADFDDSDNVIGTGDHRADDDLNFAIERDDYNESEFDQLISAEVLVPQGDEFIRGTVLKRARTNSGAAVGTKHSDPMFDTRMYVLLMADGTERELQHNIIAENMFSQADSEGRQYMLLEEITDHKRMKDAVSIEDGTIKSKNGNVHKKKTTKGWKFLCQWKDGSEDWVPLKDLKDSYPIQLAEYAVAAGITKEPGLAWWVKDTLFTRNR